MGKDSVNIAGGIFIINEEKDGIQAVNLLQVEGGVFDIVSGGGYPGKNIKSGNDRFRRQPGQPFDEEEVEPESESNGGSLKGIKATRLIVINGGEINICAGGDGIDSNGNTNMTGGVVYIDGPTADMEGAIDYNGWFTISGGTLVASGNSRMAQAPGCGNGEYKNDLAIPGAGSFHGTFYLG